MPLSSVSTRIHLPTPGARRIALISHLPLVMVVAVGILLVGCSPPAVHGGLLHKVASALGLSHNEPKPQQPLPQGEKSSSSSNGDPAHSQQQHIPWKLINELLKAGDNPPAELTAQLNAVRPPLNWTEVNEALAAMGDALVDSSSSSSPKAAPAPATSSK